MRRTPLKKENIILIIILLGATLLRLIRLDGFSLSNDELSALYRTRYDTIRDLLQYGVKEDFHPAGIQLFLYFWVKLFGNNAIIIRLPFAIAGIISTYITWLIAKRWFNLPAAIFSASALAFLQFPLLYSQIARPYASGLLFCLLAVYFWTLILFNKDNSRRQQWIYAIAYALSTAACMYNHYFSFLFAIIVGISGLFFIHRNNYLYLLTGGAAAVLLHLPHLKISLHHMSKGGLSSWLGKPGSDWFVDHIRFIFNESDFLFMFFMVIFLFCIIVNQRSFRFTIFRRLALTWFFLPFLIAYFYSVYVNPVIQHSILLFSFPFLIMLLFSFFDQKLNWAKIFLWCIFFILGIFNTVSINNYYHKQHFGEFRDIAKKMVQWTEELSPENTDIAVQLNAPFYLHYYLDEYTKHKLNILQYENQGGQDYKKLIHILADSQKDFFIYAWTKPAPMEIDDIIREYYPILQRRINYDGLSEISLYGRDTSQTEIIGPVAATRYTMDFENPGADYDTASYDSVEVISGIFSIKLDSLHEYGPNIRIYLNQQNLRLYHTFRISILALEKKFSEAQIVFSVSRAGNNIFWSGRQLRHFIFEGKWGRAFFTEELPDIVKNGDMINIYIWNANKKEVWIDDMNLRIYEKTTE